MRGTDPKDILVKLLLPEVECTTEGMSESNHVLDLVEWSIKSSKDVVLDYRVLTAMSLVRSPDNLQFPPHKIIHLGPIQVRDLRLLRFWEDLEEVSSDASMLKSLDGLAKCKRLETITLDRCSKLTDINAVADLPQLRSIRIRTCENLKDIPFARIQHSAATGRLEWVDLAGCTNLSSKEVLDLERVLRNRNHCHGWSLAWPGRLHFDRALEMIPEENPERDQLRQAARMSVEHKLDLALAELDACGPPGKALSFKRFEMWLNLAWDALWYARTFGFSRKELLPWDKKYRAAKLILYLYSTLPKEEIETIAEFGKKDAVSRIKRKATLLAYLRFRCRGIRAAEFCLALSHFDCPLGMAMAMRVFNVVDIRCYGYINRQDFHGLEKFGGPSSSSHLAKFATAVYPKEAAHEIPQEFGKDPSKLWAWSEEGRPLLFHEVTETLAENEWGESSGEAFAALDIRNVGRVSHEDVIATAHLNSLGDIEAFQHFLTSTHPNPRAAFQAMDINLKHSLTLQELIDVLHAKYPDNTSLDKGAFRCFRLLRANSDRITRTDFVKAETIDVEALKRSLASLAQMVLQRFGSIAAAFAALAQGTGAGDAAAHTEPILKDAHGVWPEAAQDQQDESNGGRRASRRNSSKEDARQPSKDESGRQSSKRGSTKRNSQVLELEQPKVNVAAYRAAVGSLTELQLSSAHAASKVDEVPYEVFKAALLALEFEPEVEVQLLFDTLDYNLDGSISFSEFAAISTLITQEDRGIVARFKAWLTSKFQTADRGYDALAKQARKFRSEISGAKFGSKENWRRTSKSSFCEDARRSTFSGPDQISAITNIPQPKAMPKLSEDNVN
eukprot:gnl/MRDRNA2_/MRDRNA2_122818_c0_seq1.p1 gnl/MRDRNA2_/MRDRNA2_122818_c0~~gnl/MRDRNA2_/MRDRNA2_122818_c0_seq1.p1  ORF type:complete len:843 (-),score=152.04 gnl/MRDRNA2_/MRDRNA2_122818_c0_seq1:80-2608(-)